ncbi:agglutinin-like [Solanum dulcamara]|uniref:agglutinin-like n=1 Tax=Solanum dulcamara TaxID=45834 RepID=UPI0024866DF2|nr:agglutinin-like [Solanum dulcamara]
MGNQVSYDEVDSILVDAWGGSGGSEWNYKFKTPIKEILINHGEIIDSIMFITVTEQGDTIESPRFGGNGGRRDKVDIHSWEYLKGIKGTYGNYGGKLVVKSLSFITVVDNIYGPFGKEAGGTPFSFVMKKGGAIVGFHGRCGSYLDAIGVYLEKLTPEPKEADQTKVEPNEPMVEEIEIHDKMEVMKTIVPRSAGPWGGCSGKGWDDGVFCTIKQVQVHMDTHITAISGIQIEYLKKLDKTVFWSHLHGGLGAGSGIITKINIDGDNEFLIGIEGFYSPVDNNGGLDTIRQITFYTNKGKYGPYGTEVGTYFSSSAARGKIIGFHGKSGVYLNAIGVHMEYF